MDATNKRWDLERAAAWLRRHGWGERGEEAAPCAPLVVAEAAQCGSLTDDDIDIAGWPALVAPFYD